MYNMQNCEHPLENFSKTELYQKHIIQKYRGRYIQDRVIMHFGGIQMDMILITKESIDSHRLNYTNMTREFNILIYFEYNANSYKIVYDCGHRWGTVLDTAPYR